MSTPDLPRANEGAGPGCGAVCGAGRGAGRRVWKVRVISWGREAAGSHRLRHLVCLAGGSFYDGAEHQSCSLPRTVKTQRRVVHFPA